MDMSEALLRSATGKQWEKIGVRHHHGVVVPLFSLHSQQSCGIGEFLDLIPLVEWCPKVGFDVIQLLPLNDTGRGSSPYGAISAFALNPIHLSLSQLPYLDRYPELQAQLSEMRSIRPAVKLAAQRVDYLRVYAAKDRFLQQYYLQASHHLTGSYDYQQFVLQNEWLKEYALFKSIKAENQWRNWEDWEEGLRNVDSVRYQALLQEYANEVHYHIFVQYLCFQQWRQVKSIADAKGVFLKGDIPIFINRDSADVWLKRNLFFMQYSAGAPPDMYSEDGQSWGFPTYNWPEMEKTFYAWWKKRLDVASRLYHIYRIDHIVGFFRVWAVPVGQHGRNGQFFPLDPDTWIAHGEKIMHMMLESCSSLPIGEDLGTVPPSVRLCLKQLGICGTRVMRWERMWDEDKRFIPIEDYIPESMTTVSTHDSETLSQWWSSNPKEAQEYAAFKGWKYEDKLTAVHHQEILRDSHHSGSLFHINLLQEYLALVPGMVWPNVEDERINIPGTISERNWSYRFRPSVEEIVTNRPLKKVIESILI